MPSSGEPHSPKERQTSRDGPAYKDRQEATQTGSNTDMKQHRQKARQEPTQTESNRDRKLDRKQHRQEATQTEN